MLSPREKALLVLNILPGMGPVTWRNLREVFGDEPEAIFRASAQELKRAHRVGDTVAQAIQNWKQHVDLDRELSLLERHKAKFLTTDGPTYPALLREIHDPPIGLTQLGPYDHSKPAVAIIGTRRPTLYGRAVARKMASEFARCGWCVVSGLARGIDTEAHEGALEGGGPTVAVLGNGADLIYPPENADLYRRIGASGAILSEFAFGRTADRQTFPMRNRVVAGMVKAVIVVESDVSGGSMITAKFAGDWGRIVCAVPGRVDQPASAGCHALIRDGATLVTGIQDVLDELNWNAPRQTTLALGEPPTPAPVVSLPNLSPDEAAVFGRLADGSRLSPDQLSEALELASANVMAGLLMLELKRLVGKGSDGRYERR